MPASPDLADLAELVRLPAVLSVPGDVLLGAAAARSPRGSALIASSAALYTGGMALNDYSDRLVDALERPSRPIPSGRIPAAQARALALGLLVGGVMSARVIGGPRAGRTAGALAVSVWRYDTAVKTGPRGPVLMAGCRALDVLLGASTGSTWRALPAAAVVAGHTFNVTGLSQQEVDGADGFLVRRTTATAAALALVPPLLARRQGRVARVVAALGAGAYAAQCLPPLLAAGQDPSSVQRAVGANVLGVVPLQAALLAAGGAPGRGAAVLGLLPLARRAAARRHVT